VKANRTHANPITVSLLEHLVPRTLVTPEWISARGLAALDAHCVSVSYSLAGSSLSTDKPLILVAALTVDS
jgi:hypothetical protein